MGWTGIRLVDCDEEDWWLFHRGGLNGWFVQRRRGNELLSPEIRIPREEILMLLADEVLTARIARLEQMDVVDVVREIGIER